MILPSPSLSLAPLGFRVSVLKKLKPLLFKGKVIRAMQALAISKDSKKRITKVLAEMVTVEAEVVVS